jgi:hypothetical protein
VHPPMATEKAPALLGVLSGTGTDPVRVTVYTGPVPATPPPDLDGQVAEVRDRYGNRVDWRLSDSTGLEEADKLAALARFRRWRLSYAAERFLGERALIVAFVDWADRHADASALHALRLSEADIGPAAALRLRWQLDQLRGRPGGETGLGIFAPPDSVAPVRGLVPTDPPTIVLANRAASLTVDPGGLRLDAPGSGDPVAVRAWRVDEHGVIADTDQGPRDLGSTPAADLLRAVGRHAPQVAVRPVELGRLFAALATFLHDAADLAADCRTGLHVRSGWGNAAA